MKTHTLLALALLAACCARADRLIGSAVLIAQDGTTIPSNTVATPSQVDALGADAEAARDTSTNVQAHVEACADKVRLYSTNYVVTSTVYVQSIGGVPYDASNQVVRIIAVQPSATNVEITATVRNEPLVSPALDWRAALNTGAWSNVSATATEISVPAGVTNAAAAYKFTIPLPGSNAFFRVVDNSTGVSGSGLWWIVWGGITVDGRRGLSGSVTNVIGNVTNVHQFVGGILAEPEPLGGE